MAEMEECGRANIHSISEPEPRRSRNSRLSFNLPPKEAAPENFNQSAAVIEGATTDEERPQRSFSEINQQKYRRRRSTIAQLAMERIVRTRERRWTVGISSFTASLLTLLMGVTIGFPSSAILDLLGDAEELPQDYLFSTLLLSLFAAFAFVGAIFGGLFGGWIADRWGRKCSLLFCGVPYVVGYLTMSYAHYTPTATIFKAVLLTGRFITGVGMGWASAVAPVYIAELSSDKLRGVFVSLVQCMLTLGILLVYGLGAISDFPYYYISLVAVGLVAVFEVLMVWLPETPRWLLSRGYGEDSESVLLWLRGKKIGIQRELDNIKKSLQENKEKINVLKEFKKKAVFHPFIIIIFIFVFQQAGGINAIAPFAATVFSDAGVKQPRVVSIYAAGATGVIGFMVTFSTIDFIGRTVLLVFSGTGMFLGTTMLGIHFYITRPSLCTNNLNSTILDVVEPCNSHFQLLAIFSVVLFTFAFNVGLGSVPWVLLPELLPLSVRGVASGYVMFTNWSVAAIVSGSYLPYSNLVRPWFTMWTFSLVNLVGVLFILIFIPETKGKSLEEIERKFRGRARVVKAVL